MQAEIRFVNPLSRYLRSSQNPIDGLGAPPNLLRGSSHSLTYVLTCLLTYLPTYLLVYLLTYILLIYLLTYILVYFIDYLLTYILTCLPKPLRPVWQKMPVWQKKWKWPGRSWGQDKSCSSVTGGGPEGFCATYEALSDVFDFVR